MTLVSVANTYDVIEVVRVIVLERNWVYISGTATFFDQNIIYHHVYRRYLQNGHQFVVVYQAPRHRIAPSVITVSGVTWHRVLSRIKFFSAPIRPGPCCGILSAGLLCLCVTAAATWSSLRWAAMSCRGTRSVFTLFYFRWRECHMTRDVTCDWGQSRYIPPSDALEPGAHGDLIVWNWTWRRGRKGKRL